MFNNIRNYFANLQKCAAIHPDSMMRLESKAELAVIRLVLYLLALGAIYVVIGFLAGIYLCWFEGKCL